MMLNDQILRLLCARPEAGSGAPEYGDTLAGRLRYATDMLLIALDGMWEADLYADSLRDGWNLGKLTAQIARDADARADELSLARTGRVPPFDADRRWDPQIAYLRPGGVVIEDALIALSRLRAELGRIPESEWAENKTVREVVNGRISAVDSFLDSLAIRTIDDAQALHTRFY